jgi:hypothetical protein
MGLSKARDSLRNLVGTNLSSKATALVLAVVLYFYMYNQLSDSGPVSLMPDRQAAQGKSTLVFEEPAEAFVVLPQESISVTVSGPKALVKAYLEGKALTGTIQRDRIGLHVPRPGESGRQVAFDRSDVTFDVEKEVEVTLASPEVIRVLVDRRGTWSLPLRCQIEASGDIVREHEVKPEGLCDPAAIDVIGPEGERGRLGALDLAPITFSSLTQTRWTIGESQVRVKLREKGLDARILQPVTVRAQVSPRPVEKRSLLPFSLLVPSHVAIETDTSGQRFLVPASVRDSSTPEVAVQPILSSGLKLRVTVNGRVVGDDLDRVPVELRGPDRSLDAARLQAAGVRVYVDLGDFLSQRVKFTKIPLQALRLPEGVTLGKNEAEISIEE